MTLTDHLQHLEETLLSPATRSAPRQLSLLLAAEFREIGSSGRLIEREQILGELGAEAGSRTLTLSNFACHPLSDILALVTYRSVRTAPGAPPFHALRSSIWILRDARWQMLFHQGTPVP